MRPELPLPLFDAPPIGVQVWYVSDCVGSMLKMRKWAVNWSAIGSPRSLLGTGCTRFSDHVVSVPVDCAVVPVLVMISFQVPVELLPLRTPSGNWGLYGPRLNGGKPCWMGVVPLSSKIVFWKSCRVVGL